MIAKVIHFKQNKNLVQRVLITLCHSNKKTLDSSIIIQFYQQFNYNQDIFNKNWNYKSSANIIIYFNYKNV